MSKDSSSVLDWYSQFTVGSDVDTVNAGPNVFQRVEPSEIERVELAIGMQFPNSYVDFLLTIGAGRLAQDKNGVAKYWYENRFMPPSEIQKIVEKKTDDWLVYPEFIAPDDLPFFNLGNQSVFVFRNKTRMDDAVYDIFGTVKISGSFIEFLESMHNDCTFPSR